MSREIRVGDRIRDNDPRMPNRTLQVVRFSGGKAVCLDWSGRRFFIALPRIYTDGKARKSGFSLIEVQP